MKSGWNKSNQHWAVLGIIFIFLQGIASAAGASAAQFLKLGAGARAAAMGNAFAAIADDATAAYWNAAGLSQISTPELSLTQNNWLVDTQYQYVGLAVPFAGKAIGISVQRMDFGSIDRYTASDVKDGSFDASSLAGALTFAGQWGDHIRYGATGKFIQESIEAESASTFAGDIGVLIQHRDFNIGFAIQNMGPGLKFVQETSPLPQIIRFGVSTKLMQDKILATLETSKSNDNDMSIHGGAEYNIFSALILRGGYKVTPGNRLDVGGLTDLSAGMGLNLGRFSIDYAFLPFGDLGTSHQVSLLVKFR